MQAQVVHQRRTTIPWIPVLVAALLVAATALTIQIASRDRAVTPPATSIDRSSDIQKAGMSEAGIDNLSGTRVGTSKLWVDPTVAAREGRGFGAAYIGVGASYIGIGGSHVPPVAHPQMKFGGSEGGSGGGRDAALRATITRIEQAR